LAVPILRSARAARGSTLGRWWPRRNSTPLASWKIEGLCRSEDLAAPEKEGGSLVQIEGAMLRRQQLRSRSSSTSGSWS